MNEKTQLSVAMQNGLLIALALILYNLLLYVSGMLENILMGYLGYFIFIGGLVWGIKSYRDKQLGGIISYGEALGSGTLISLFAAIILAVYIFVFFEYIEPDMMENQMDKVAEDLYEQGISDEQIEMGMKYSRMFSAPWVLALGTVMSYVFFGFLFSLIISIFLKKKPEN